MADRMKDQVGEKVKTERSEMIRKISESNRLTYMGSMLKKEQKVLVEKVDGQGMARGYGEHYLPVRFPTGNPSRNRFENVILERVEPGSAAPYILASAKHPGK